MSNLAHELMADEEWAQLSDAERINRLELVIDLLFDIMIADEDCTPFASRGAAAAGADGGSGATRWRKEQEGWRATADL